MSTFGFATPMATPPRRNAPLRQAPLAKTIPFDYAFQFALQGRRGNKVQDVVEISTEGVFVALSVGYSLVLDEQSAARTFQPVVDQGIALHNPVFVPFFEQSVGSPPPETFVGLLLTGIPGTEMAILNLSLTLPSVIPTARIGSDRTATVLFTVAPGSILRVWDKTHNLLSELFQVATQSPAPVVGPNPTNKNMPVAGDTTVHVYGVPGDAAEVFLFENSTNAVLPMGRTPLILDTTTFGHRTGIGEKALQVTTGGTIEKPLSPGDVLLVRNGFAGTSIQSSMFAVPRQRAVSDLSLAEIEAGLEKSGADLTRGFRLNPAAAPLAAAELPLDRLANGTRRRLFETGSVAAEEVSFLYSLDVGNTGREYQSKPIHNIAGLGIANGDRPSRPFAKPMVFEPRSFIRLQIEELSGPPGTLFIVLQGYKILGTGRIPG
jgi:hypothetical protein